MYCCFLAGMGLRAMSFVSTFVTYSLSLKFSYYGLGDCMTCENIKLLSEKIKYQKELLEWI